MFKLTYKIVALCLLAIASQYVISNYVYVQPPIGIAKINNKLKSKIDVYYFGDSTLATTGHNDKDNRAIPEILSAILSTDIAMINGGGYHTGLYLGYVNYLISHRVQPKLLVLPINMRSFSQQWDTNPVYTFKEDHFFINNYIVATMLSKPISIYFPSLLDVNNTDDLDKWLTLPVMDYDTKAGIVRDFQGTEYEKVSHDNMVKKIIFHYRYKLDVNHPKIKELNMLIQACNANNIKLILYITPVDVDFCNYVYPGTKDIIKHNVDLVVMAINNNGATVIDLSRKLTTEYFSWRDNLYPNEHLNEFGRMYVAKSLAFAIRSINN